MVAGGLSGSGCSQLLLFLGRCLFAGKIGMSFQGVELGFEALKSGLQCVFFYQKKIKNVWLKYLLTFIF
jgi:hypothetical protein